jgi:hypothetical protein
MDQISLLSIRTAIFIPFGDVHKLRIALGGEGVSDLLRTLLKILGFVRFFATKEGERGLKSRKIALRNLWTSPYFMGDLLNR